MVSYQNHRAYLGMVVIMDTINVTNLTNVPLLQYLYPMVLFCTPAQIFVPQEVPGIPELSVR